MKRTLEDEQHRVLQAKVALRRQSRRKTELTCSRSRRDQEESSLAKLGKLAMRHRSATAGIAFGLVSLLGPWRAITLALRIASIASVASGFLRKPQS